MDSFADVIDAFGGPPAFSEAMGLRDSHARTMKARGSIPPEYWPRVISEATERGIQGITYESLTLMHVKARTPSEPERATP